MGNSSQTQRKRSRLGTGWRFQFFLPYPIFSDTLMFSYSVRSFHSCALARGEYGQLRVGYAPLARSPEFTVSQAIRPSRRSDCPWFAGVSRVGATLGFPWTERSP